LSGAKLVRFRHNDASDLDKRLARAEDEGGRLVVLEGIYSMMGDRAPLADFVAVKKKHGFQRFRRRHVLEEHRRHRRLRRRQSSAVRHAALCLAALYVHGLAVAGNRRYLIGRGA
jgi:hypothetical protein